MVLPLISGLLNHPESPRKPHNTRENLFSLPHTEFLLHVKHGTELKKKGGREICSKGGREIYIEVKKSLIQIGK